MTFIAMVAQLVKKSWLIFWDWWFFNRGCRMVLTKKPSNIKIFTSVREELQGVKYFYLISWSFMQFPTQKFFLKKKSLKKFKVPKSTHRLTLLKSYAVKFLSVMTLFLLTFQP